MTEALCPNCKRPIHKVRPIRIATDTDDRRWAGRIPEALGFVCMECGVLLPLISPGAQNDA